MRCLRVTLTDGYFVAVNSGPPRCLPRYSAPCWLRRSAKACQPCISCSHLPFSLESFATHSSMDVTYDMSSKNDNVVSIMIVRSYDIDVQYIANASMCLSTFKMISSNLALP